tara:strand:- start:2622 stop:3059 length:438 start_codon:yes stop_codon:yes gene_type:complete
VLILGTRNTLEVMTTIEYKTDIVPDTEAIIEVYNSSGINRPTHDKERIAAMYANSNLVVTAWHKEQLVGISRSLTDFCYACYLSDLAVKADYQKEGIGKQLIAQAQAVIGEQTALILLAAPQAMEYYPKVGFDNIQNGFIMKRKK